MIVLRLAAGGRVAVRGPDVAVAQKSPWGCIIQLASDGTAFETEHSLDRIGELLPDLWFRGLDTFLNPDRIASIWEEGGRLHYRLEGGLVVSQAGADLHQFLEAIEEGRRGRAEKAGQTSLLDPT